MSKTQQLDVFVGTKTKVGTITLPVGSASGFKFTYDSDWMRIGFPISPYIPFNGEAEHRSIDNFLRNLLPEGTAFDEMLKNTTVSKDNTFALIAMLGAETSGALSFRIPNSEPPETAFREVPREELVERLERSSDPLVFWDGKVRLSVAGVQDKLNMLKRNGVMGFGEGSLSSNYILKFESGKAPCIVANEFFCMTLAKQIGMDVANVEIDRLGNTRTLVIERFDRKYVEGRDVVARKHVIDGCQATDLPPSYKYERQNGDSGDGIYMRDGVSFPKLLDVETVDNVETRLKLVQWMTFNLATLNYDAHGKNISFFVTSSGLRLAPFYDLVNIEALAKEGARRNALSGKLSAEAGRAASIPQFFAMSVGDWDRVDFQNPPIGNFQRPITAFNLADFADKFGYSPVRMKHLVVSTVNAIKGNLDKAIGVVSEYDLAEDELEHITMCSGLIETECEYLLEQAEMIEEMSELL